MLKYKGYTAHLEVDAEEQLIHGTVLDLQDVIYFEGETIPEAVQSFHNSVDDYLDLCKEMDRDPQKPFSGHFTVRISPEIHRGVHVAAASQGKSLNSYVESVLETAIK